MFNSMIAPLQRFSVRAILWWQAEANGGEINAKVGGGHSYECEQTAMIKAWRDGWRAVAVEAETPFIFVLLEAFKRGYDKYNGPVNAIRAQQLAALSLPRVGMVSAIDIADNGSPLGGIHPRNKPLIGYRLASVALSLVFGVPGVAANGPMVQSLTLISSTGGLHTLHLQFKQSPDDPFSGVPLEVHSTSDCETPYYFNYSAHCCALAGESGPSPFSAGFNASETAWEGFRPASGWTFSTPGSWVVEIIVRAAEKPVWLGLMWEPLPGCAVYNGANLPAVPRLLRIKSDDEQLSQQTQEWWRWVVVRVSNYASWIQVDDEAAREDFLALWEPDLFDWAGDGRWNVREWARMRGRAVAQAGALEYEEALFCHTFNQSLPNIVNDTFGSNGLAVDLSGKTPLTRGAPFMTHAAPKWALAVQQGDARAALIGDAVTQDNSVGDISMGGWNFGFGPWEEARYRTMFDLNATFSIRSHVNGVMKRGLKAEEVITEEYVQNYILFSYKLWRDAWRDVANGSRAAAISVGKPTPAVYGNVGVSWPVRSPWPLIVVLRYYPMWALTSPVP
jgi:hypothetical protein